MLNDQDRPTRRVKYQYCASPETISAKKQAMILNQIFLKYDYKIIVSPPCLDYMWEVYVFGTCYPFGNV